MRQLTLPILLLAALVAGCNGGPGKPSYSDIYDVSRETAFDAMIEAFDAYYDLDDIDRRKGTVETHWDMTHARAIFSKDGWRARGEGRLREQPLPGEEGRSGWQAEVKVHFETNHDRTNPLDPYSETTNWRQEGTNPQLARNVIDYMDTLLKVYGPSEIWRRENE